MCRDLRGLGVKMRIVYDCLWEEEQEAWLVGAGLMGIEVAMGMAEVGECCGTSGR